MTFEDLKKKINPKDLKVFEFDSNKKYIVFANPNVIDIIALSQCDIKNGPIIDCMIYPFYPPDNLNEKEIIKIYEIKEQQQKENNPLS